MSDISVTDALNEQVVHTNTNEKPITGNNYQTNIEIISKTYEYEPPVFTDSQRLEKIKTILPTIDKLFEQELEKNHFPGLSYGVIVDGNLIHSHSFGWIDLERNIPASSKSLFRIASMTKSFTAMAIVKLRDDGKLRLDDPIHQYVPELKMTNMLTTDAPILTIRHLLTQDVGMPEDDPWADRQLDMSDDELLEFLKQGITLSNPPVTVWEYTNVCFAILGRIITVVSQMPCQIYIKKEILEPLGMTSTYWEYSEVPSELLAQGYRWECNQYVAEVPLHDGTFGPMGGLISSVEDFSKYVAYHLQAQPSRNDIEHGPIRRSSLREMQHPWNFIEIKECPNRKCLITSSYCYGLFWSKSSHGIISIEHAGGLPGFGSNWIILPSHGVGLVTFSNRTYANVTQINAIIMDKIVELADLKPRQLFVSKFLAEKKQLLITVLQNKWDITDQNILAGFAENFFLDHSLKIRKTELQELLNEVGNIKSVGPLNPQNQLRGIFNIECEHATIKAAFSLSPENPPLIQELKLTKTVN